MFDIVLFNDHKRKDVHYMEISRDGDKIKYAEAYVSNFLQLQSQSSNFLLKKRLLFLPLACSFVYQN